MKHVVVIEERHVRAARREQRLVAGGGDAAVGGAPDDGDPGVLVRRLREHAGHVGVRRRVVDQDELPADVSLGAHRGDRGAQVRLCDAVHGRHDGEQHVDRRRRRHVEEAAAGQELAVRRRAAALPQRAGELAREASGAAHMTRGSARGGERTPDHDCASAAAAAASPAPLPANPCARPLKYAVWRTRLYTRRGSGRPSRSQRESSGSSARTG